MKKILIGLLAVLVLVAAAALIVPSVIDWNAYRAEIAAEAGKVIGRTLSIDGDIDVALLPAPKLTLAKARLSNLKGAADPDMVRLAGLDLRIAFWPLLSGKVVVQSVVLRGADIRLEKLADGRENWNFKEPRRAAPGRARRRRATSSPGPENTRSTGSSIATAAFWTPTSASRPAPQRHARCSNRCLSVSSPDTTSRLL